MLFLQQVNNLCLSTLLRHALGEHFEYHSITIGALALGARQLTVKRGEYTLGVAKAAQFQQSLGLADFDGDSEIVKVGCCC